jgi:hypothetical protein
MVHLVKRSASQPYWAYAAGDNREPYVLRLLAEPGRGRVLVSEADAAGALRHLHALGFRDDDEPNVRTPVVAER